MKFEDIISNSFKYPFGDLKRFSIICILFLLPIIPLIFLSFIDGYSEVLMGIFAVLLIIDILIVPGYFISVVREGCNQSKSIPSIRIGRNIINTFKYFILELVYNLVPILVFIFGIGIIGFIYLPDFTFNLSNLAITKLFVSIMSAIDSFLLVLLITAILLIIFTLVSCVAIARFAKYDKLSEGFKNVIGDLKEIGVIKLISWYVMIGIFISLISNVAALLLAVPHVGNIIYYAIILPYLVMVYFYSLGLLYSDVGDTVVEDNFDLDEFEVEVMSIRRMYK